MDLTAALHQHFGFPAFRPGQREACEAALADRDVLVVMPTGSGKSLCYQLPALLRDDLTVVVSPLVALMQDQVEALAARGLGDRWRLSTPSRTVPRTQTTLRRAEAGELRLLYVAPERFAAPGFLDRMRDVDVGPVRGRRGALRLPVGSRLPAGLLPARGRRAHPGRAALVASTATATPQVARDVVRRLALRDPLRVATGFDRPNISFAVARPTRSREARDDRGGAARPTTRCRRSSTRARARAREELASELTAALGEEAVAYHAGLDRERRAEVQRRFLADDVRVICATNAFGMGVDKPNVRTVVHASVPSSLEAYYQEAGRGGPRRRAGAGAAAGGEPRQGAARPLHQARASSTQACRAGSPTGSSPRPTATAATTLDARTLERRPERATASGCARCSGT